MPLLLYDDLADWYWLVDPTHDHADEAAAYADAIERAASGPVRTLLELGAGAGNNAWHLKQRFACTLADPAAPMRALSGRLNPDCEHIDGDMRTLRLPRSFDAVLVHDAVVYMTSEADLAAAVRTAFAHLRAGGAALFAPDYTREAFRESTEPLAGDDATRSMRGLAWCWDPDPSDDTFVTDYLLLLRDGTGVRAVHDRHIEGLFSTATWLRVLGAAGFEVQIVARPIEHDYCTDRVFVCRRP